MIVDPQQLEQRARDYARKRSLIIADFIGGGTDGSVWKTKESSVIKALERQKNYEIELGCYQRLQENGLRNVCGLAIPRLLGFDGELLIIEMELVSRPCLIDFGKAYLDSQPEHSPEQWEAHIEWQREIWGGRFDDVQSILWRLEQIGIYYRDPTPANIMFADWNHEK